MLGIVVVQLLAKTGQESVATVARPGSSSAELLPHWQDWLVVVLALLVYVTAKHGHRQ